MFESSATSSATVVAFPSLSDLQAQVQDLKARLSKAEEDRDIQTGRLEVAQSAIETLKQDVRDVTFSRDTWKEEAKARASRKDTDPETEEQPRQSNLRTIDEILARATAYDWLVKGWVECSQTVLLWGESQTYKSLLAIEIACAVALALEWRGNATKQGAVLYVVGEGAGGGITRRLKAWQIANGRSLSGAPLIFRECPTMLPDDVEVLAAEIREMLASKGWKLELVILDTLSRTLIGDESSAKDFGAYQRALDSIRQEFGCAGMIVHHTGHDKTRERGSYSLRSNVDVNLSMEVVSDTVRRLHAHKVKDAELPEDMFFAKVVVDLGETDEDGKPVTSVVLRKILATEQESSFGVTKSVTKCKLSKAEESLLQLLEELIDTQRDNLEAGGYEPEGARVTLNEWRQAAEERNLFTAKQHFYRAKDALRKKGRIKIATNFVALA